jgi:hypothetical protein
MHERLLYVTNGGGALPRTSTLLADVERWSVSVEDPTLHVTLGAIVRVRDSLGVQIRKVLVVLFRENPHVLVALHLLFLAIEGYHDSRGAVLISPDRRLVVLQERRINRDRNLTREGLT